MEKIKPLFDRVLLTQNTQKTTDSGIYMPTEARDRSLIMRVVATGEDVKSVQTGQTVIIAKYAGVEIPTNNTDEKLFIIREIDILGVVS